MRVLELAESYERVSAQFERCADYWLSRGEPDRAQECVDQMLYSQGTKGVVLELVQ